MLPYSVINFQPSGKKCRWQRFSESQLHVAGNRSQLVAAILDLFVPNSSPGSLSSPIQDGGGSQASLKKLAAHVLFACSLLSSLEGMKMEKSLLLKLQLVCQQGSVLRATKQSSGQPVNTSIITNVPDKNLFEVHIAVHCDLVLFLLNFTATYWMLLNVKILINETSYY